MNTKLHYTASLRRSALVGCGALALSGFVVSSCTDPTSFNSKRQMTSATPGDAGSAPNANEDCPADPTWLPVTPPVRMFTPPPHPDTECPFYRGAYQTFLTATQPLANGDPVLVQYATLDDTFKSVTKHYTRNSGGFTPSTAPGAPVGGGRAWLGAIRQAGERQILIDRDHHTLFYGLHMNQAFVDFVNANGLETVNGINNVDPNLAFPPGVAEFKTAWKDIDPRDFPNGMVPPPTDLPGDPGDYSNYITTMAWIPHLKANATTVVEEDPNNPVLRKVALVAIHCVFTLPGHPEFVWGSIQHVNTSQVDPAPLAYAGVSILGRPDSQPDTSGPAGAPTLPDPNDPQNAMVSTAPSSNNFLLYPGGTPENKADQPAAYANADLKFDELTQTFTGQVTPAYRMFPGSKSNTLQPDSAVFSLNSNINALFSSATGLDPNDKRMNYRLVAAVWMDKPELFGLGPDGQGMLLQNDENNPLVIGAKNNDPMPNVSQGTFCGTPLDSTHTSGDSDAATGANNSVPGCQTRQDLLTQKGGFDPLAAFQAHDPALGGTDSPFSILGGEDRLSSTSMETFTQNGQFNNCFTCHNTQSITTNGTPTSLAPGAAVLIQKPAKINVSHMFSEFILREQEEAKLLAGQ